MTNVLIFLAFAIMFILSGPAAAKEIRFCNKTPYDIWVSALDIDDAGDWIVRGWFKVSYGTCRRPLNYTTHEHSSIYYYAEASGDLVEELSGYRKLYWRGKDGRSFCIHPTDKFRHKAGDSCNASHELVKFRTKEGSPVTFTHSDLNISSLADAKTIGKIHRNECTDSRTFNIRGRHSLSIGGRNISVPYTHKVGIDNGVLEVETSAGMSELARLLEYESSSSALGIPGGNCNHRHQYSRSMSVSSGSLVLSARYKYANWSCCKGCSVKCDGFMGLECRRSDIITENYNQVSNYSLTLTPGVVNSGRGIRIDHRINRSGKVGGFFRNVSDIFKVFSFNTVDIAGAVEGWIAFIEGAMIRGIDQQIRQIGLEKDDIVPVSIKERLRISSARFSGSPSNLNLKIYASARIPRGAECTVLQALLEQD